VLGPLERANLNHWTNHVESSLMLRPTVSRSVCLGIKHTSGAHNQIFISQTVAGLLMWGALSNERTGQSFTTAAGPRQRSQSFSGPIPVRLATIFYYLRFQTSLFVASYDWQGYGIRPCLHTG
jgi:hypothetical protein